MVVMIDIIAITANALFGEDERCIAAGMDDYMSKPVEMEVLKQTLVKWMGDGGVAEETPPEDPAPTEEQKSSHEPDGGSRGDAAPCPIDDRMLKDMFGDDDAMFKEILQSFIEPSEAIVADLMVAHSARSSENVKAEAHKLKSSSRSVGANDLADTCLALETAGKEEDWGTIDELAPKLEPLFEDVKGNVDSL
jgi:two-component system sensor histidine kinase/response regulator